MTTLTTQIRRACVEDAAAIARVHEESWRQAYNGLLPHSALDRMVRRRDPQWWARAIRQSTRILALEVGGTVAGYATIGPNRVRSLPQAGEVYELYLAPEYQGLGFGKTLFLAARRDLAAAGLKGCLVWVLEENEPACRFYRNAGGRDMAEGTETFDGTVLNKVAFAYA